MIPYVICIDREYGSGGRMVGQKVAQTLEIPFYDNQLMDLIAKESGLAHETVQDLAERAPGSFLYNIYTTAAQFSLADQVFLTKSKIIRDLAQNQCCVIVSAASDYILREHSRVLKVFLWAPTESRIQRIREVYHEAGDSAATLRKQDKKRASYYQYNAVSQWGDRKNYDLVLNTDLGLELTAQLIRQAAQLKFQTNLGQL